MLTDKNQFLPKADICSNLRHHEPRSQQDVFSDLEESDMYNNKGNEGKKNQEKKNKI